MEATHDLRQVLGARGARLGTAALGVGVAALAGALYFGHAQGDDFARLQRAWLVGAFFFLSLSLGGLFFVLIQHVTRAGWSVAVRRVAELVAANTIVSALLFTPLVARVFAGDAGLYPWADREMLHHSPALEAKAGFFDARFFAVRCAVYFAIWIAIGAWLLKRSSQQDDAADAAPTRALERRAPPLLAVYALSVNFAAFDLLMTLDPHWYSTIFGVYVFAGSVVAFFAFTILSVRWLQRGSLARCVGVEHFHDLGKFLFAFVFFWSYIAFSQFMLIWYADLPEETEWYRIRLHGPWAIVSAVLLFGHFLLPMAGLLSRHAKRRLAVLTFWAVWLLVMHAVDLFWLVHPRHGEPVESIGALVKPVDALAFVAVGGLWLFALTRLASKRALVPVGDPRLPESLSFENV